jgi:branched-chain amino acid transport system ATP-binding protein
VAEAPVLTVQGLGKSYGGVIANHDVSLIVRPGEVHGLIGPNGAGKTTLISMLAGQVMSDAGRITLDGADVTYLPAPARARLGIRRSFQISSLFPDLTVSENLMLACSPKGGLRAWRPVARDAALRRRALDALAGLDIGHLAPRTGAMLSHGERRLVELAMVLADEPRLLLLDEPFAGLGQEETADAVEKLRAVRGRWAMLLIEHDLAAVFALADTLTVMVMGTPIATGDPASVRADAAVQAAYLGEDG